MQGDECIASQPKFGRQSRTYIEGANYKKTEALQILYKTKVVFIPSYQYCGVVVLVEPVHQHLSSDRKIYTLLIAAFDFVEENAFITLISQPGLTLLQEFVATLH